MIKYQSEAIRKGPPADHELAVARVIEFWNNYSAPKYSEWIIDKEWIEHYNLKFIREMKLDRGTKDHFEHTPDICIFEWLADQPTPRLIIEVDGQSHNSNMRQISDGIFESWISEKYKGICKVIRLQKAELIGPPHLALEYLLQMLGDYLRK